MTTVKQLIEQLQENHDPDEPIVFQYLVADHTAYNLGEFEKFAEFVMDNAQFGQEATDLILYWLGVAEDRSYQEEEV
jgi:hypothetical protein